MRKGMFIFIVCVGICTLAYGCSKEQHQLEVSNSLKETQVDYSKDNISVIGDIMYAPIGGTTVHASRSRRFSVQEFVDLRTGVVYMAYNTSARSSSASITPVYNSDGTLKVYEDLDALRDVCGYKEDNNDE